MSEDIVDLAARAERLEAQVKQLEGERAAHSIDKSLVDIRTQERNQAYTERNRLVALLAAIFPSWRTKHQPTPSGAVDVGCDGAHDWDPEWLNVIGIQLPTGQCTWHIHDSEMSLFEHVPEFDMPWDGHTTDQKYERIAQNIGHRCGPISDPWRLRVLADLRDSEAELERITR